MVAVGSHSDSASTLRDMRRRGTAWSPLPGVYARADVQDGWETRVRAAHLWAPNHVLAGTGAARLMWWPDLRGDSVEIWGGRRDSPQPWLTVRRCVVPAELITWVGDMKVLNAQASALQLALSMGGNPIDEVLRRRMASLAELGEALELMPNREGNTELKRLLWESREQPWSELEREAHRRLRKAGIKGWKANARVSWRGGGAVVDILFPGAKLAIEMDGFEFHRDRHTFIEDRRRQNSLVLHGWTVLRFTWESIDELVPEVQRALRSAGGVNLR